MQGDRLVRLVNERQQAAALELEEPLPEGLTEDLLARHFTERHGGELRYVAAWRRWLHWRGAAWRFESTLLVFDLARAICREAALEAEKPRAQTRIASAQTVAAIVRLAEADRTHARSVEPWDLDPWLLGTPGGTADLRNGTLRAPDRADHITKLTAVAPADGDCPLWLRFLDRVTGGDADQQAYLQRFCGYVLTGSNQEHVLGFIWGPGGNGKGVLLNTLTGLLGDYATVAPMETFTVTHSDRHPTDLAMLRAARLVASQETEEGRRWAENRLKSLTGGDPVTARFMRQDFFTFVPQFKLLIAGNHKPRLRNVDEAIRRRLHLIPFTQTIGPDERDPQLAEKLKPEWPAILAWAIRGCLAWQSDGLRPPACVLAATEDYLAAEDAVSRWLEDCCVRNAGLVARSGELFASWKAWAEHAGEYVGSQRALTDKLEALGFQRVRDVAGCRGRGLAGLGLKAD